ncbi:MAG: DNA polymerase III subunit delta' [Candidatus Firestonebacteria bacterium]
MLKDILGHNREKEALLSAFRKGRLAHGYIFNGPSGTGKFALALEFAKYINCEESGQDACGKCTGCLQLSENKHPDLMIVQPVKATIKIEQIREAKNRMAFKASFCKYKVLIINEAEKLGNNAADSLLKLLEEPSGNTLIILITSNLHSIQDTLRSRSQVLNFSTLSAEDTTALLKVRLQLDPAKLEFLSNMAEGRPGEAIKFYEEELFELREEVFLMTEALLKKSLLINTKDLAGKYGKFKAEETLDQDTEDASQEGDKEDATKAQKALYVREHFINILVSIYRDIVSVKLNLAGGLVNTDKRRTVAAFAERYTAESAAEILQGLNRIRALLKHYINFDLAANDLLLRGGF